MPTPDVIFLLAGLIFFLAGTVETIKAKELELTVKQRVARWTLRIMGLVLIVPAALTVIQDVSSRFGYNVGRRISYSNFAMPGDTIALPYGKHEDWSIIVVPSHLGSDGADNYLLKTQLDPPIEVNGGWKVNASSVSKSSQDQHSFYYLIVRR